MPRRSSTASSRAARGRPARAAAGARRTPPAAGARVLHLDPFSGIAGNMFVGALLDLGLSRSELVAELEGLGVDFALRVRKVARGPLAARYVSVGVPGARRGGDRAHRRRGQPPHQRHGHGRHYREIVRLLEHARLDAGVRTRALAIFEALGRAEARVHGIALDAVHFHEVGAVDAIVDVTAAAIGLDRLGVERVTCAPVGLGHGTVDTDHGRLPLPAPATLELLRGVPSVPAHVAWETVTPTGAAILSVIVDEYEPLPAMTIERVGYGAGDDRAGPMPNVLRAVLGRSGTGALRDRITLLETQLDDLVPEHFDFLMERLFEAGALDVSLQNVQMKKNRPGFLVRVLARPGDRQRLAGILFAESTTIGVRSHDLERLVLRREARRVVTPHGRIRIKLVYGLDGDVQVSAEYDDCRRAARAAGVALREVVRVAESRAREELS